MPAGVDVTVVDGVAEVAFLDPGAVGPGVGALLAAGGRDAVTVSTAGLVTRYRVPESVAAAAGLLDVATADGAATDDGAAADEVAEPAAEKPARKPRQPRKPAAE